VSPLVAAFDRVRREDPARPLIHLPARGHAITASEIWQAQLTLGEMFRSKGLETGRLLLAALGNNPSLVPVLLAARSIGLTLMMIEASTPDAERNALCRRFGAAAIAVPHAAAPHGEGTRADLTGGIDVETTDASVNYGRAALLKLTSGSTGLPKAIVNTEEQLIADSRQIVAGMGIEGHDTQIAVIPLSHAYGVSVVLVPLVLQGTAMVLRDTFVPQRLPEDARASGATTFPGVPFMFEHFVAHPPEDGWPGRLTRLISAGARLEPATVRGFFERFGLKIHSFYGASESGGICYDADDEIGGDTVGRPLPGVTLTFKSDDHAPRGTDRVHVTSAGVASGYLGEADDGFCDGGFLSGDYGLLDAEGRLKLRGRASAFINVAGRKVHPAEVEDVLRQMPGVTSVHVLAAADPHRGEHVAVCMAVARDHRDEVTTLAVRQYCSSRLAPHKIPRTVVVFDTIPLTSRGKIDRRALEEAVQAQINGPTQQLC
jgi:long-chain acyl-CoA synthetase